MKLSIAEKPSVFEAVRYESGKSEEVLEFLDGFRCVLQDSGAISVHNDKWVLMIWPGNLVTKMTGRFRGLPTIITEEDFNKYYIVID